MNTNITLKLWNHDAYKDIIRINKEFLKKEIQRLCFKQINTKKKMRAGIINTFIYDVSGPDEPITTTHSLLKNTSHILTWLHGMYELHGIKSLVSEHSGYLDREGIAVDRELGGIKNLYVNQQLFFLKKEMMTNYLNVNKNLDALTNMDMVNSMFKVYENDLSRLRESYQLERNSIKTIQLHEVF